MEDGLLLIVSSIINIVLKIALFVALFCLIIYLLRIARWFIERHDVPPLFKARQNK